jgi:hypothetical protein
MSVEGGFTGPSVSTFYYDGLNIGVGTNSLASRDSVDLNSFSLGEVEMMGLCCTWFKSRG